MGLLKCYDWNIDDTGNKTCPVIGYEVNGVTLGDPNIIENENVALFEHTLLPNGIIDRDGIIK